MGAGSVVAISNTRDVVFHRGGWFPFVIREVGDLRIELGAGAAADHSPRTFSFPISAAHLDVIRADLARHLMLWSAILRLCEAAGISRPLDEGAAVALLDPILLGTPNEANAYLRRVSRADHLLVAHGADIELLDRGEFLAALRDAAVADDRDRVDEHRRSRSHGRCVPKLTALDEGVLNYCGHLLQTVGPPTRRPDIVDPGVLPVTMRVVATAEQESAGASLPRGGESLEDHQKLGREWQRLTDRVEGALRATYPELSDHAIESLCWLMCFEAPSHASA